MEMIANIATIVSSIIDIVLFVIALYTFYLTFLSNNVKILSVKFPFGMWKNKTVEFLIKNLTLKTVLISKVYAIFDNKYRLPIEDYDTPKVLDPLKTLDIVMPEYTSMDIVSMNDLSKLVHGQANIHLEIITDENKIIYATLKGCKSYKPDKKAQIDDVHLFTSKVGDMVLKDDYIYLLRYKVGECSEIKTAFINNFGLISTDVFGFNVIPKENLLNKESIKGILNEVCKARGISVDILDLRTLDDSVRESEVTNNETKI